MSVVVSEQGLKWYDGQAQPVYERERDGKKQKATVVQARKHHLYPSLTSIIKILGNYLLERWMIEQHIRACVVEPFHGDPNDPDAVEEYIRRVSALADDVRQGFADRGKELHKAVEDWLRLGIYPDDPVARRIVEGIHGWIKESDIDRVVSEVSIVSPRLGYGATPDILGICEDGTIWIADLKTTNLRTFRSPYTSWKLQLGGEIDLVEEWIAGRAMVHSEKVKFPAVRKYRFCQIVADRNDGAVRLLTEKEYKDVDRWRDAFRHLYEVWVRTNTSGGYDPRVQA